MEAADHRIVLEVIQMSVSVDLFQLSKFRFLNPDDHIHVVLKNNLLCKSFQRIYKLMDDGK